MQKRKIQINQLKKIVYKGKKVRTIFVKYEAMLAYFKQKEYKDRPVFTASFMPLIHDLLNQLAATEPIAKFESESKEPLKSLPQLSDILKLDSFELKALSKESHIQQLCSCLFIEGHNKRILNIQRGKLMSFFKHLRTIYPDLSDYEGEKIIIEASQLKNLYELFVAQWDKYEEKGGRLNSLQKIQRKLCRSLYFLGVVIENNILQAIEVAERRKKEENSDLGTKSEHKRNIKGVNQQVSTVHSFASLNPSLRLKSEASQQESFPVRNNLSQESQYSQYSRKSQRSTRVTLFNVWDKGEINNLVFKVPVEPIQATNEVKLQKFQINYLSNDVENILIEQAFKMQKFTDSCYRNVPSQYQYTFMDYSQAQQQQQCQYDNYYCNNYMPYEYVSMGIQNSPPQYLPTDPPADNTELNQLKRSLNMVQTRKMDKDRYQ